MANRRADDRGEASPLPAILLVDDNHQNLQLLGTILKENIDCSISVATSGSEALRIFDSVAPDLILLDVIMPELDGYEVCRRMKAGAGSSDVPVIFITAHRDTDHIVRGFEAGGADYVGKPFDPVELIARVRTQLELRRSQQEMKRINDELRSRNDKMENDLKVAQSVQKSIIRMDRPVYRGLAIDFRYHPMDRISGDYFAFFPGDDDTLGFFIGDVSGHGVASALFIALVKSVTDRIHRDSITAPHHFLNRLNADLLGAMSNYFLTGIYGSVSRDRGGGLSLAYAIGAHPRPLLLRADGAMIMLGNASTIIGVFPETRFALNEVRLEPGDRLFFYTDGIPETENEEHDPVGFEGGLMDLFRQSHRTTLPHMLDAVFETLDRFRGSNRSNDDITIIGIEVTGE